MRYGWRRWGPFCYIVFRLWLGWRTWRYVLPRVFRWLRSVTDVCCSWRIDSRLRRAARGGRGTRGNAAGGVRDMTSSLSVCYILGLALASPLLARVLDLEVGGCLPSSYISSVLIQEVCELRRSVYPDRAVRQVGQANAAEVAVPKLIHLYLSVYPTSYLSYP